MSFTTLRTSAYEIKRQPEKTYLSTIESTLVVLEALNAHKIESIKKLQLQNFLSPFLEMIKYQKDLIANPKSHAVRFKRHPLK